MTGERGRDKVLQQTPVNPTVECHEVAVMLLACRDGSLCCWLVSYVCVRVCVCVLVCVCVYV